MDGLAAGVPVDLGELVVGAGEADLESFDFAEPAFVFGFADAGDQVVADLGDAGPLGGVGPEHRAADAGVLMDAGGGERPAAVCPAETLRRSKWPRNCSHSSSVGVRYSSVGSQGAAAGQECQVVLDHLVGVDGLVAEGDVDVAVAGDDLGDVRGQPGQDRVGDEHPAEVVRGEDQRLPGRVGQPGAGERGVEHVADGAGGDLPGLGAAAPLEQQRGRGLPDVLVAVVAGGQRDLPVRLGEPGDDRGRARRRGRVRRPGAVRCRSWTGRSAAAAPVRRWTAAGIAPGCGG